MGNAGFCPSTVGIYSKSLTRTQELMVQAFQELLLHSKEPLKVEIRLGVLAFHSLSHDAPGLYLSEDLLRFAPVWRHVLAQDTPTSKSEQVPLLDFRYCCRDRSRYLCALADFRICEASRTASIADFLCFSPGKACKFSRGFLDSGLKRLDAGSLF